MHRTSYNAEAQLLPQSHNTLNRDSMFAFQWREFSLLLSSTHRLLQCYHSQKRDRRRCNSWGILPQPHAFRVISQWACILEWRHAVTMHILVGKICISLFIFYCKGMLSLVALWLCDCYWITRSHSPENIKTDVISGHTTHSPCSWPFGAEMVVRRGMTHVVKHSVLRPYYNTLWLQ